jgi:hypothetical protein
MKKSILFVFIVFCKIVLFSQANVYHPFPDSNAVWLEVKQHYINVGAGYCDQYQYSLGGDTLIGSDTCKKLYKSGMFLCSSCAPDPKAPIAGTYSSTCIGGLRQDIPNKKVYFNNNLIYDFTLKVGDSFTPGGYGAGFSYTICSIDSALVGNNYHKRFNLNLNCPNSNQWIIEGIGYSNDLINGDVEDYQTTFLCFKNNAIEYPPNGLCNFLASIKKENATISISIYPNPGSGNILIATANTPDEIQVTDLIGKTIFHVKPNNPKTELNLPKTGVYFVQITIANQTTTQKVIVTD